MGAIQAAAAAAAIHLEPECVALMTLAAGRLQQGNNKVTTAAGLRLNSGAKRGARTCNMIDWPRRQPLRGRGSSPSGRLGRLEGSYHTWALAGWLAGGSSLNRPRAAAHLNDGSRRRRVSATEAAASSHLCMLTADSGRLTA